MASRFEVRFFLPSASTAFALALLVGAGPTSARAQEETAPVRLCGSGVPAGEVRGFVAFPDGTVFCPLFADPKNPESFLSLAHGDFPTLTEADRNTDLGSVGLAESFGLARWGGSRPGNGVQIGLSAGVFAQFDLRSASFDLINADYVIGIPVTVRISDFTLRLRPYHQSSHLGDEYLLRDNPVQRQNLSFESLELILSEELGGLRLYSGGEYLFRREPSTLDDLLAHAGAEVRLGSLHHARFVVGADAKSSEQQEWKAAWSVRAGLEVPAWHEAGRPPRLWRILVEYYNGPSPYGQFYQEHIRYYGIGLHISQ